MKFSEIMNLAFGGKDTNSIFESMNLILIENSPQEILHATLEMEERLAGKWQGSQEDLGLQERFWSLFGLNKVKSPDLRIGAQFLRDNVDLIQ